MWNAVSSSIWTHVAVFISYDGNILHHEHPQTLLIIHTLQEYQIKTADSSSIPLYP